MAPRGAKGYEKPERLPEGTTVEAGVGSGRRRWKLGPPVGSGGFGDIYSAKDEASASKDYPFVVKIEPHGNGPLFVEMHFYMRNAKKADIDDFKKAHQLKTLGMPEYVGSGSHEYNNKKYRFVIMERYGKDLWHRFLESGKLFPAHTVFRIALQMLDVYQYIHSRTYVHADLKGANILFGLKKGTENQTYLLDFGLASHYSIKEFKRDPKKAHNGTIEYTSRDAHNGVPTRRGDMEILGYNIVHWLTGSLPWETDLRHPANVQTQKEKYMADIPSFLKKTFTKTAPPCAVTSYLQYVSKMEYDDTPDYKACRQFFESGLKTLGYSLTCNLDFTPLKGLAKTPIKKLATNAQSNSSDFEKMLENSDEDKKPNKKRKLLSKEVTEKVTVPKQKVTRKKVTKNDSKDTIVGDTSVTSSSEVLIADASMSDRILRSNTSIINETADSVDIFDDSCIESPPKRGTKRKHTKKFLVEYSTDEEVTVHTTVKKKSGMVKEETRSWRKCPTVLNGRSVKVDKGST